MKISETHKYEITKDGKPVSRVYVRVPTDESKLVELFRIKTNKNHRRKGHAATLIRYAIEQFGHRRMRIYVSPERGSEITKEQLYDFYDQFGFKRKNGTQTMIRMEH